jgi:uncharacterized RDD family membrane protein YckC
MASASEIRTEPALDTTVRLVTPERIVFAYPLAGPFRRYFAYLLDLAFILILVVAASVISLFISFGSASGLGPAFVAYFVMMWGYRGFSEAVFNGRTLGKWMVGIRVVSDQGVPITASQAILRNVVGTVDGAVPYFLRPDLTSMLLLIGLTTMVLTRRFQRMGDLAAGTMVVVEDRRLRGGVIRVNDPEVEKLLPWLPLRIEAGTELARVLSDYVKRRDRFGRARREEMAASLARPLRARYGLPDDASNDAVLCAVYHRVFLGE